MKMLMVAAVSLAVLSGDPPTPSTSKELKQLQGEWVLQGGEKNGTKLELQPDDPKMVLEIRGDKWIFTGQEKGKIIAMDSKILDIKSLEEGRVGQVDEGIYKLSGDTLTFCIYQGNGKNRPTEFTSKDEDTIVAIFTRLKS
jgi:uncharacterized protein (TIGR03067 family)